MLTGVEIVTSVCAQLLTTDGICRLLLTSNPFRALHPSVMVLYIQQAYKTCQCKKTTAAVWNKLAAAPPKRKAALIRSLLPGIEAALNSGQSLKDIWEALETEGLQVSYHTFHMAVWRARKEETNRDQRLGKTG